MSSVGESLKNYVFENSRPGDVKNILHKIDEFGWTKEWLMNIGDRKGLILDQAIEKKQPKLVLELGIINTGLVTRYSYH
jgi:catechol O-methyltransferase